MSYEAGKWFKISGIVHTFRLEQNKSLYIVLSLIKNIKHHKEKNSQETPIERERDKVEI